MAHAAEWSHWYDREGKAVYEVEAAKGGRRPTTLRDARKLDLVPSVTSIISCAAAPGLERWKQQQVLHAALTLPRIDGEAEEAYLERIMLDSQEQARSAAERGTAIHAAIQNRTDQGEFAPHVQAASNALKAAFGEYAWVPERSFAHSQGFGGKVDDSCLVAVIDYKSTEKQLDSLETYDNHWMQLAAYREGLRIPSAHCAIVYVSVRGEARVMEIDEEKLQRGWKMFQALLDYWYAKTGLKR